MFFYDCLKQFRVHCMSTSYKFLVKDRLCTHLSFNSKLLLTISYHVVKGTVILFLQGKTCVVHFCRKRNLHPDPDLHIRNQSIPVVNEIQAAGVFHYPPWKVPSVKLIGLFDEFRKNDTSSLILKQIFFSRRFEYVDYTTVYTDGSRAPGRVGFGGVIDDATYSHGLSAVFSVYSAEAMAILYAL
ncbi:hypothetical protein AVEN_240630-1 [Araneus ventricosus]|uniref:RNase H type-1 domain-containing protein n=1 Tax=Araneus ventricosus TaxID=182803 RepID=A0A4Y2D7E0_ARAVE|nr:hypothetical protein AVEN_240630-1 [Araneus ventricosus]